MPSSRIARPAGGSRANPQQLRESQPPPGMVLEPRAPDLAYLFALIALVSVGMIMVYSATAVEGEGLLKHGKWVLLGAPLALAAAYLPLTSWRKLTPLFLAACLLALISLEIPSNPFAVNVNGATRWIRLPGGNVFQPSEFAKLAFVLFAARFLERRGKRMQLGDWALFGGVLGLFSAIIYKEPDLGTALVLVGTAYCMLIAAGVKKRILILVAVTGTALIFLFAWTTPHQKERLKTWLDPWAQEHRMEGGYQVVQSWVAMARGGLTGVGLGQSTQKLDNRLPESETDFIFAIIAEELGLLRALGVLALFGLLAWRGFTIAARAPDRYSSLVVTGITSWVAVQSALNVAVATGTTPNTGVPLPFISSGGSSLIALLVANGIVIKVSRQVRPRRSAVAK